MKKIIFAALLTLGASAFANPYHHGYHKHHHRGYGWAPWVGGAVVGAVLYDIYNRPVIVQQPPIVVQQPPVVVEQRNAQCSGWTETRQPDGSIVQTRICQ
jgi:hypothetical protein